MPSRVRDGGAVTLAVVALALAGVAGCATQSDIQGVQQENRELRRVLADNQATMESVKREIERSRGDVESVKFQAGGSGTQIEQLSRRIDALESRLVSMESMVRSSGVSAQPAAVDPVTGMPISPPPAESVDLVLMPAGAPREYREAYDLLQQGNGQGAVQKLRDFLRVQPKSEFGDDAQFLVGEAYYQMRDFNRAILELNEVLLRYPRGDRVPAALLRQAFAFAELGDKVDARLVLQKLVSEHGSSPEAELGRRKLSELAG